MKLFPRLTLISKEIILITYEIIISPRLHYQWHKA